MIVVGAFCDTLQTRRYFALLKNFCVLVNLVGENNSKTIKPPLKSLLD